MAETQEATISKIARRAWEWPFPDSEVWDYRLTPEQESDYTQRQLGFSLGAVALLAAVDSVVTGHAHPQVILALPLMWKLGGYMVYKGSIENNISPQKKLELD